MITDAISGCICCRLLVFTQGYKHDNKNLIPSLNCTKKKNYVIIFYCLIVLHVIQWYISLRESTVHDDEREILIMLLNTIRELLPCIRMIKFVWHGCLFQFQILS